MSRAIQFEVQGLEALFDRIDLISDGVQEATVIGLLKAGDEAVSAAEDRIKTAITLTGLERQDVVGGEPGRIETGQMIRSLRGDDGTPASLKFSPGGNAILEYGYWNNPPPYTEEQETTEYSISGKLLALQDIYNVLEHGSEFLVDEEIDDLVKQSKTGTYRPKVPTFRQREPLRFY